MPRPKLRINAATVPRGFGFGGLFFCFRNTARGAMVNSSSVDALLWKGSRKVTKVQRVGIVIWVRLLYPIARFEKQRRSPFPNCPESLVYGNLSR
jgi:hypothetical protein